MSDRSLLKKELLKQNWFGLLDKLQGNLSLSKTVFDELITAHTNSARYYHNLNHVWHLLTLANSIEAIAKYPSAIELAAWFHDYVYDPQAKDNEVKSAMYAEETLTKLNIDSNLIDLVKQIILSTQKHQPLLDSIDNLLFLDLDLSILGASGDRYWQYAADIRKEYSWLGDRDYQLGRKQVLTSFLARGRIYYTDYFYQRLEHQARDNLVKEIESLSG